jgi:hypothetical protein
MEEDCEKLVSDSNVWFTEEDICQFMTRKEEEPAEPQPEDD